MTDQVEQNPTPDQGGASTLDPLSRIERLLAAEDGSDDKPEDKTEGTAETVETEDDATDKSEPQITTSDLAKYLGVDEAMLDLDEDGTVKFKTKIDGQDGNAKLADFLKTYQIQGHAENKAREVAKQEEALRTRQQEVEQQFTQRLQYAERLNSVAAQQLMHEFQSINWQALEQQDPGTAALYRQKFQERHGQLQQVDQAIKQEKAQAEQKSLTEKQESLRKEAERLVVLIPEWKDQAVANKEKSEISAWAQKAGYEPSELEVLTSTARNVQLLRKAMLADRLQASKPEIENKVRAAPKLVKPGQAQQNTAELSLRNLKQSVQKSGGKGGAVEAYLLATGRA